MRLDNLRSMAVGLIFKDAHELVIYIKNKA